MKYSIALFGLLAYSALIICSKNKILTQVPRYVTAIHSLQHNLFKTLPALLEETNEGDSISITTCYFTNKAIAASLAELARKNVKIKVIIDQASWNTRSTAANTYEVASMLREANIDIHTYGQLYANESSRNKQTMHLKSIIWKHTIASRTYHRVLYGSANLSNNAKRNLELMILYPDNENLYNAFENYMLKIREEKKNYTELRTVNNCLISVHPNTISALLTMLNQGEPAKTLHACSFSYNSIPLTKTLLNLRKRNTAIHLIIDASILTNTQSIKQLNMLHQAGARIYVANKKMQHAKFLIKRSNDTFDSAAGSGNLTWQAEHDINLLTLHNNDKNLYYQLKKIFYETLESCSEYQYTKPIMH